MIRTTEPRDTPGLIDIAVNTGVFKDLEVTALREVLDDYHAGNRDEGHVAVSHEQGGRLAGFAYYAPAEMTDRTWYLWWILVDRSSQGRGIGAELLNRAEDDVRRLDGRLLLIETSSLPMYEPTRRFYRKHGYDLAASIPDYYYDGDDLCVFSKRLIPREGELKYGPETP